ncbi:MAG: CRISPR-associated protein Cas6 [Melioribacteraceae bacterium]|nr:MAG: CRISPR-associated protein Cas6 [Melioribacteraceae bacterium]
MIPSPPIIHKYNFRLEALEDMNLPEYKGSMFRGAFGWAFRKAVCVTRQKTCENCMLQSHCSYFKVFETEIPENNLWFLKGVKKTPHPFVIHPPQNGKKYYKKGEMLTLGLTIFGEYVSLLPFFVFTIQQMGKAGISYKRSNYELIAGYNFNEAGDEKLIFKNSDGTVSTNSMPFFEKPEISPNNNLGNIKLHFTTPLRIQKDAKILKNPADVSFEILVKNLYRRLQVVYSLFCNVNPDFNYESIPDISSKVNNLKFNDWQRFSNRQNSKVNMGGFEGEISFDNVPAEFISLFHYASKLNIGKNTVFGLGQYEVNIS